MRGEERYKSFPSEIFAQSFKLPIAWVLGYLYCSNSLVLGNENLSSKLLNQRLLFSTGESFHPPSVLYDADAAGTRVIHNGPMYNTRHVTAIVVNSNTSTPQLYCNLQWPPLCYIGTIIYIYCTIIPNQFSLIIPTVN